LSWFVLAERRKNVQHPTYEAFAELGKAMKAVFPLPLSAFRRIAP
jgi:TnpA family transposase